MRLYRVTVMSDCDREHRETYRVRAYDREHAQRLVNEDPENIEAGWLFVSAELIRRG